jgi:hypothetical protein
MQDFKGQNSLVEFIYNDNLAETTDEKIQLVRVLSRSSTLPKVQSINILPLSSDPDGFYIQAGRSIKIGVNILANPVIALVYIRYGLEWQIWYKSQSKQNFNPKICDMAACQVSSKFYDTIPEDDKQALKQIPEGFFEIFQKFKTDTDLPELSKAEFEQLGKMHNKDYPEKPLKKESLNSVRHLAYPLEYLLLSGGDMRLQIDPNQLLNKYGCRPFPRPKAFTFASSTATSISNIAFNQSEKRRENLIAKCFEKDYKKTLNNFSDEIKADIKFLLSLPESSSLILAPSGTDISLLFAGLCQTLFDKPIVHILVASDETGSGVPLALMGKHFSDRSSQGVSVLKGTLIETFKETATIDIRLRNQDGKLKSTEDLDREVTESYGKILEGGKQPVLHVMNQSKLGYSAPSERCLLNLEKKFGKNFFALIDNSQLRMNREKISDYIKRDYAMTVTGSKFFTGPPFNGALIIPENRETALRKSQLKLPDGLINYVFKNDFPTDWNSVQKLKKGTNLGTLMRWYASIIEVDRYFETPVSLRNLGTEMFCKHVQMSIDRASFLEGLAEGTQAENNTDIYAEKNRTIFPFFVFSGGKVLSHEDVGRVYKLLNQNLSDVFDSEKEDTGLLGDQACHIGQPVKAVYKDGTPTGVVRISLGSRVISESWKDQDVSLFFQKIEEQMNQVDVIIRKIKLILEHPEWLG